MNINGCRGAEKLFALFDFFSWKKASVVFLQETHTHIWTIRCNGSVSHDSNVSAGVEVLISSDLQIQDSRAEEIIPGRMQIIEFTL